ncbi:hypothetical protein FXV83_38365 [Bradyrhizobium hipponense]|uniref:Uncharacterized protein n=1 Tax=Bradyrhizobium hipponense TaxID=2605638 RepID=A0A5S4YBP3_9BRAD|nr:hypothetical protein [Bradyrhizobium hipponense]TYO61382.1 hypothetical protein FXV83_38365 [Bradyrhizobium hipponense]
MSKRLLVLICLWIGLWSVARADDNKSFDFNAHKLTLSNGSDNKLWGWIELLNGSQIVGYIYVTETAPREPHLNSDKTYVVMDAPISLLDTLLNILRNEKPLRIRYSKFGNSQATAFLESTGAAALTGEAVRTLFNR